MTFEVWGVHPESDDRWKVATGFKTRGEANDFINTQEPIDHGLGFYEVTEKETAMKRKQKDPETNPTEQVEESRATTEGQEPEESAQAEETTQEAAGVQKFKAKLDQYHAKQIELLRISDVDLNEDFVSQAPSYLKAALKFAEAERVLSTEKQKLDEIIAAKYMEAKAGTEKTTEAFLEKASKQCEEAQAQKRRVILAEYQVSVHQSVMRAWDHKRDMLIQVGAVQRAEMAGQTSLRKTSVEHDDVVHTKNGRARSL